MVKPVDPAQGSFNFGENPEKPEKRKVGPSAFDEELAKQKEDRQDKAKSKAAENEEFKDKRQPKSELIRQAEIERMKEILNKPKVGGGGGGGVTCDPGVMRHIRLPWPAYTCLQAYLILGLAPVKDVRTIETCVF
jgi:hypothetical protein